MTPREGNGMSMEWALMLFLVYGLILLHVFPQFAYINIIRSDGLHTTGISLTPIMVIGEQLENSD